MLDQQITSSKNIRSTKYLVSDYLPDPNVIFYLGDF
jgi:hypothetical protein